jgi:hypothetical protein
LSWVAFSKISGVKIAAVPVSATIVGQVASP